MLFPYTFNSFQGNLQDQNTDVLKIISDKFILSKGYADKIKKTIPKGPHAHDHIFL